MGRNRRPNCEKVTLEVNYPLGVKGTYTHYSWNRWTAVVWSMWKSMCILIHFPMKKINYIRFELDVRPCIAISL